MLTLSLWITPLPMLTQDSEATPDIIIGVETEPIDDEIVMPAENEQDVIYLLVSTLAQLLNSFGGGVIVGALTFAGVLKMIQKDVALQTSIERLAVSLPPEVVGTLNNMFGYLKDIGEVGEAITDGKPNVPLGDPPETTPTA